MEPFTSLVGVCAPLLENDVNTDQIAPVHRELDPDYASLLFSRRRYFDDGREDPDFVLNRDQYRAARMLVVGENFGCGSSRESAVWSMLAFGIRCVIARSFADTYRENCLRNGLLPIVLEDVHANEFESRVLELDGRQPVTVDLNSQTIRAENSTWTFSMPAGERHSLLMGLDDIGLSLTHADEIVAFERAQAGLQPWLQHLPRVD